MMDAAEEIPQLVCPEKKPRLDGETLQHSPAEAAAIAKVLDDDNLLWEIIICVGLPTTLVRAALVCKRWLGHASDPKFLSCFCKLHPPRLLGYYISEGLDSSRVLDPPRFVPVLPQPTELAAVMRRLESYSFGTSTKYISDCRNGSLLTRQADETRGTYRVHRPLCPEKGVQIVPPLPPALDYPTINNATLSKKEGSGFSYLHVFWENTEEEEKSMMRVYMLVDGVWCMHTSVTSIHVLQICSEEPLVGNEIYMPNTRSNNILALDLTTSSFSTIQLPQGVTYRPYQSMLSWEDDTSSLYLIDVEEFQLRVWLHMDGNWLLVDTICLREMLATLGMSDHTLEDESMHIIQVGHNGLFVFLQRGQCIFSLDIKCRTMCKVYEETINGRHLDSIYPFMMIWPPTFPPSRTKLPERPSEEGSF